MNRSMDQLRKFGKKALTAALCALAAAALAIGSLVDAPDALFSGASAPGQVIAAKADADAAAIPKKKLTLRERLRRFFFTQPSVLREALLLPLWAVGKAGLSLLTLLFSALNPLLQGILGVLLNASLLFGLFALVLKLLFPEKRLRDIFTKRNIVLFTAGALLLTITDTILRAFWADYRPVSIAIKLAVGLIVLALLCWRIFGRRIRWHTAHTT